jgi:TRAP transporter TAXI family solute receptor
VTVGPGPAPARSVVVRRLVGWAMGLVLLVSLAGWLATRDRLPPRVRIATAAPGGLYHLLGSALAPGLERRLGRPVEVIATAGSQDNLERVVRGEVELAMLQGDLAGGTGVAVLTPLLRDAVHVVVRVGGGIGRLTDLEGHQVSLGPPGSGMRRTAEIVLRHYGVEIESLAGRERYFGELLGDDSLEAAIVTTDLLNPELGRLLASGRFELLPVEDAEALAIRNPLLESARVPRGFYHERPPVPADPVLTVATTTVLVAREDAPARLVEAALAALYDEYLRQEIPTLIERTEAAGWSELPRHAAAVGWFEPYSGLGILANLMESLAALKELLFAFGAALYLGFGQWRRFEAREREAEMHREKERLDVLFEETMRIEAGQMLAEDPAVLRGYLDEVTRIKLRALEELTHEDLRGDVTFGIFLQQCANLTRKIQSKVEYLAQGGRYPRPADPGTGQPPREG